MSTATVMTHPVIETELFNLLRVGFARVERLLENGEVAKAKALCQRINGVCGSFSFSKPDLGVEYAASTPLSKHIRDVYSAPEFKIAKADGSDGFDIDCSPLCWSEEQKACIVD